MVLERIRGRVAGQATSRRATTEDGFVAAAMSTIGLAGALITTMVIVLGPVTGERWDRLISLAERVAPGVGRVVGLSLRGRIARSRALVATLTAVLAATSAILVVATSVRYSFARDRESSGAIIVTATEFFESITRPPIFAETVKLIEETPGVDDAAHGVGTTIMHEGRQVGLSAFRADVWRRHEPNRRTLSGRKWAEVCADMIRGGVVITHNFGRTFGVGLGDEIALDSPKGIRSFPIVGVIETFSSGPTGRIRMHLPFFQELWPETGSRSVIVWTDGPEEPVIDRIAERTKHIQPLFFIREAKILNCIDDLVAESRGLLLGWLSSGALLGVIDETLGWHVEFYAAPGPLAATVIAGCALASLLPGLRARRVSLREELLVE